MRENKIEYGETEEFSACRNAGAFFGEKTADYTCAQKNIDFLTFKKYTDGHRRTLTDNYGRFRVQCRGLEDQS